MKELTMKGSVAEKQPDDHISQVPQGVLCRSYFSFQEMSCQCNCNHTLEFIKGEFDSMWFLSLCEVWWCLGWMSAAMSASDMIDTLSRHLCTPRNANSSGALNLLILARTFVIDSLFPITMITCFGEVCFDMVAAWSSRLVLHTRIQLEVFEVIDNLVYVPCGLSHTFNHWGWWLMQFWTQLQMMGMNIFIC
jgi:hypothetical protein